MNAVPLLSIITINYNDVSGLERTLSSIKSQTQKEFDHIVIDGGSVDGSKKLLESNDKFIDYWISEPDNGVYNAMNKGIDRAKGDYVLFLNSGDILHADDTIEKAVAYIENKDKDIYYGDLINRGETDQLYTVPKDISFFYFYKNSLPHPSSFIRKSCLVEMGGYDENLKIVSDWKFYIVGVFKKNYSLAQLPLVVSIFYAGGISTTNYNLLIKERELILKEEFPLLITDYDSYEMLMFYFKKYKINVLKKLVVSIRSVFHR